MTAKEDEIRLKELLSVFGKERYRELINILDRDQKRYHKEQLTSHPFYTPKRELLAISCLNNIIQPIDYLKQLAELDGGKLDGSFAVHLTKQGMFYQELAKKAIKEIDNCG